MEKKSKILLAVALVLLFVSVFSAYKRFYVDQDYIIIEDAEEADLSE